MKKALTFAEYSKQAKTDNTSDEDLSLKHSVDMLLDETMTIYRYYSTSKTLDEPTRYLKQMAPNKMGDLIWYINNICTLLGTDLESVANDNLGKVIDRWGEDEINKYRDFDDGFRSNEKIPRKITYYISNKYDGESGPAMVELSYEVGGRIRGLGDEVDDNTIGKDHYRYHDIFHISYLAHLGWSPVMRRMLKKKRRSNVDVGRAEDGRRAADTEEAMTSFIYMHSTKFIISDRNPIKQEVVDFRTHRTIDRLVSGLEVRSRPRELWIEAIYQAIRATRFAIKHNGCTIKIDLNEKSFEFSKLPEDLQY